MKRLFKVAISLVVRAWDITCERCRRCLNLPLPAEGVILYYHAIKPAQRSRFARQMDELLRWSRPFCLGNEPTSFQPGRHAAVTFDDGFVSVVEHGLPELRKRSIPFTVFVPSGCLGGRPSWIKDPAHPSFGERVVSRAELKALAGDPLATVGSHSISHPNFLRLGPSEATEEFRRSKMDLEFVLGSEVTLFSFPHGAHNSFLDNLAHECGYDRVFTIEPQAIRTRTDRPVTGRVQADPDDWLVEFRLKLAGAYRWQAHLKSLRRR